MNFDVYCDESRPDLFASSDPKAQYMVLGSLWLPTDKRAAYKGELHNLRDKHKIGGEFKWQKVSNSKSAFYRDIIDWFLDKGDELRFRCIAVEQNKVNLLHYHQSDQELGFYKFYYQMLHHWIMDFNEYQFFCDYKTNARKDRLHELKSCLANSNLSSTIKDVQATRSKESVLIQCVDFFTGMAAARLNGSLFQGSSKDSILNYFETKQGHPIRKTAKAENKFNVFIIDLHGGW